MPTHFWRNLLSPSRLVALLGLATIACAVLIAHFTMGDRQTDRDYTMEAQRLMYVHDIVDSADRAKASLLKYETSQSLEDKSAFLVACDAMAAKVGHLRQAEHMSEEQSDAIIDLCVSIRQQLSKLGSTTADRMSQAGYLVDRIRRVVIGFGIEELRAQNNKLAEQSNAAELNRRMTLGMAGIEILMVAGIIFLVIRLTRLEQLATVCAWSHRLLYQGKWVSLERYLEQRFGIRANDGITTEQAAKIMADTEVNAHELLRLIEFEKAAAVRAKEANRAIHAVRNHLTAVLCYSEMANHGDAEATRDMASASWITRAPYPPKSMSSTRPCAGSIPVRRTSGSCRVRRKRSSTGWSVNAPWRRQRTYRSHRAYRTLWIGKICAQGSR